jgi:site-specific DNA-methyltransferase (adenine-specific)
VIDLRLDDCLDFLPTVPDGSVDLVLIDPPYSTPVITAFGRKKVKNLGDLSLQEFFFRTIKAEFERILKPNGRLFIFCDDKYYPILYGVFYGWNNINLVIWDKGRIGMGNPFRKRHELIMYANRGEYEYRRTDGITHYPSVMNYKPVSDRVHGAQKPLDLVSDLIKGFTDEGDTVLDCFVGSGTTAAAAVQLGRNFIGCEINPDYFEIAQRRIESATVTA